MNYFKTDLQRMNNFYGKIFFISRTEVKESICYLNKQTISKHKFKF